MADATRFYIGGQWVEPSGKARAPIVNPADRSVVGEVALGGAADADAAIAAAKAAFPAWSRTTREERLAYLEAIGMAAAAVDCRSARIGDGADMLARGIVSHANAYAALCGVAAGQSCREAAARLRGAAAPKGPPPPCGEGRWRLMAGPVEAWALDSIGKVKVEDGGRVLVIGSHGALHGGRADSALPVEAAAAVFHDAGVGADRIGISRLPVLGARGIPAVAVDGMSARIGDGRSLWETGVVLHINAPAAALGATRGLRVPAFAALCARAPRAAQNGG